ncbi:hypothetical protein FGG08_000128 [Glutinoglossum americanum]|uniref:SYO1-like TPR repeats domain-containing protein n=1 Tax=Glutinoglossum americanum TaxID=1670608 RepID=A0A9P8L658_9PEZI|nr:hypothetical protein FGG08_000128 [Glutinoglossum americanum]
MGKSKRKGRPKPRTDPTIGRPAKSPSDPETAAIRDQKILPVLSQLSSPNSKSRSTAASAIANLIEDQECRKLLLKDQVVRLIMEQTLTDSEIEVVVAGWGVLRNLALEEDWTFGIHLYRQDILTPLEAAIKNVVSILESTNPSFSNMPKPRQILTWELTGSLIGLLSSLSETNQELVDAISNLPSVPSFLFGLLGFEGIPEQVKDDAILCIHALTEENDIIAKKILEGPGWLTGLSKLKNEQSLQGIAACGIIHNISQELRCFDQGPDTKHLLDSATLPALKLSLEGRAQHYLQANGNLSGDDPQSSRIELSLRLGLEILASIATAAQEGIEGGLEGAIGIDAMSEGSGDENDMDQITGLEADDVANHVDEDVEMELVTKDESGNVGASGSITSGSHEAVIVYLVEVFAPLVLPLAAPQTNQTTETLLVYSRALSALNNIAWAASQVLSSSIFSPVKETWTSSAQRIWKQVISPILSSNTADISLADSITSLAWALSRGVGGKVDLAEGEHRSFMALYRAAGGLATSAAAAQTNGHGKSTEEGSADTTSLGVKCIGVLGTLALCPSRIDVNRETGVFLVTLLAALPQTPTDDAVEALNQLFDIYADKAFDYDEPVFWGNGLLSHLEAAIPNVRKMAKAVDKRKQPDMRGRADEALMNLGRFVKYKKDEKAGRC